MNELNELENYAIDAAIAHDWNKAIEINKEILAQDQKNISAYLRLGFAYLQKRDLEHAQKYYKKAVKIQPSNNVALDNLERIKILQNKKSRKKTFNEANLDPNTFLEIPSKTKTVTLVNIGQKNLIAQLSVGQRVYLKTKKRRVEIRTSGDEYIGCLPDDLSRRLILFLKDKSDYFVHIKEATLNKIVVFIKEGKKGSKVARFISFPKNIQNNIAQISNAKEDSSDDNEEVLNDDIEKLAEVLTNEEKDYLPYSRDEAEEEEE